MFSGDILSFFLFYLSISFLFVRDVINKPFLSSVLFEEIICVWMGDIYTYLYVLGCVFGMIIKFRAQWFWCDVMLFVSLTFNIIVVAYGKPMNYYRQFICFIVTGLVILYVRYKCRFAVSLILNFEKGHTPKKDIPGDGIYNLLFLQSIKWTKCGLDLGLFLLLSRTDTSEVKPRLRVLNFFINCANVQCEDRGLLHLTIIWLKKNTDTSG